MTTSTVPVVDLGTGPELSALTRTELGQHAACMAPIVGHVSADVGRTNWPDEQPSAAGYVLGSIVE